MTRPLTIREARAEGERRLRRSPAIDHWPADRERRDAEELLQFLLGDEGDGDLDLSRELTPDEAKRFHHLVRRRAGGEPISLIVGWTEFRGLRFAVAPGVFLPRQSSEFLVEQAVRRLKGRARPIGVDLATGIGPISIATAHAVRKARIFGADLSRPALRRARLNAKALGLRNVSFHRGDLFGALPRELRGRVDVVTLHPPYVPREEVGELPLEVRGFEPEHTLTDYSPDGMGLVERTAVDAWRWLRPGGWLLIEVSPDRSRYLKGVLQRAGYGEVRSTKGWPEITRVVVGRA